MSDRHKQWVQWPLAVGTNIKDRFFNTNLDVPFRTVSRGSRIPQGGSRVPQGQFPEGSES